MNADIERLYQFLLQQMAADSYLESIPPGSTDELRSALLRGNNRRDPDLPTSGLTRFTKVQATEFVGRYEVVNQLSENPSNGQPTVFNGIPLNTGFSATLIRERGTENYTLAIRSTEIKPWSEGGDRERDALGADLALAWDGFAWAQIDTMEKYYSWLKSSGTLPPGARLDVTGYSLGGHLATVFTELHRADPAISFGQTVTFNAPGRGTLTQSDASMASALAFYRAVLANPDTYIPSIQSSAFGKYIAAKAAGGAVNGLSIYGDPRYVWAQAATQLVFGTSGLLYLPSNAARTGLTNGAEMITTQVYGREFPEDRSLVANSGLHGPARSVFVEGQPRAAGTPPELYGTGDYGGGHSIVLLADSLALMRGLNQLDAAQTIDSLGQILVRASSRTPDSKIVGDGSNARAEFDVLENALDALRRALLGSDLARTPYATGARGFGDISARDGWYNNLNAVTTSAAFATLVGKVTIVPVNSANAPALAATAKVDFGDLVALQTFSPFTIKPSAGDPAAVGALTAVWQSGHGIDYAAWQADAALTTQQRAAGNGTFSDAWYADRSTMLRWLMKANEENIDYAANGGSVTDQSVMQPVLFQDLQSETTFTLSRQPLTPDATGVGRVIFGRNDAADAIYGADANDRLYGGGGSDALHGQDGNDYLEGNAGNDVLRGGARNDILVGGAGGDELHGEGGNDRLLGGSGSDVYFFNSGDGLDTIVDTDGQIVWDGQALTGGFPVTGGAWRSADRQFTYSIHDDGGRQTLYIKKAGLSGTIAVENFSRANRDLSIWLSDMPGVTTPPTTTRNITGDLALLDTDPTSPGLQTSTDDIGNTFRSSVPAPGFADFFMDSAGNDRIRTGGGADFIAWSRGGSDDVDAGDGNDGVSSGSGDDWIAGGNGADELVGGDGSDVIIGGADDDVILTEHEIAYDSSTYALVVPPGASVVRNWTYDGRFASSGYGIQVVQYTLEGITFESPWVGIGGWIERRDATAHDFVDAGDGSDLVYGGYGSDVILGGNGSDRLEGSGGDDLIDGGSGNDVISGDAPASGPVSAVPNTMHGSDQLFGGSGDDLLLGGGGSDILDGGDDDDVLYGDIAAMNLAMPVGTPFLEPTAAWIYGADILRGGAGNDRIHGEAGDDVLIGGPGDDTLMGDEGNDVFEFDRGDGADQVFTDSASNPTGDELHFGAGIDSGSAVLRQMGFDLQIDTGVPADSVSVKNWFRPGMEQQVVELHFADGTVWTRDQINAQFVLRQTGTAGADTLSGFRGRDDISGLDGNDTIRTGTGADLIEGGKGNDSLDGGLDNDRYVFRAGDGADVITANDQLSDDVLRFVGVLRADVTFARAGDALVINASNGTDKVTINRYFEASNFADSRTVSGVQTIEFDGGVRVGVADIRAMFQSPLTGTANSDYLIGGSADEYVAGAAGNDTMFAYGGNDTLLGGDGNDYLDSGLGADLLDGGPGDDTLSSPVVTDASRPSYLPPAYLNNGDDRFVFGRGYGHDSVAEDNPSFQPSNDAILLKDLLPSDVAFGRGDSGNLIGASNGDKDLLIRVHGSSDYLRVVSFFDENPRYWIESIVFADGSTWGRDQVIASLSADLAPTSGSDYLLGSPQSDSVDAGAGSDVIWLGDGNDAAEGGDGDDHLQGGSGSDFLSGDAGSDQLYGGTGADVLDGGPGDDYLFGGIGLLNSDGASDTFVFRRGSGHDTIPFTACSGDADTVYLDGLGTADIELGWTIFNALQIRVLGTDDVLQVENQFDSLSLAKLETIRFGDGATYDATTIENLARQNRDDLMTGSAAADVLDGGRGNDDLRGGAGNDTLLGGPGDDRLDGETGVDIMDGGAGNDFFIVDDASDAVIEGPDDGVDRVAAKATFVLPANVEALSLIVGAINGTGNSLDNSLTGSSAANRLDGGAGNDVLDGGAGADTMLGGPGDDTFYVDSSSDTVAENANEGTDLVIASVTRTLGVNQEHLALSGAGAINGTGNSANNYLKGNSANNTLNGSSGTDALQGGGGNDTLTDTNGRGVHDGGDGDDTLTGGTDRQFFAGGVGNDTLTLGGGADLIAFNRGQGADAINAPTTGAGLGEKNDLISLSGVAYGELRLARESTDLVLKVAGTTDSIRLKNWYGSSSNQTVSTLQVLVDSTSEYNSSSTDSLRNRRAVRLNFGNLVSVFDAAGSPTDWSIPQSNLTAAYVAGSDVDAIGGLLAYRYARDGNLASVDFATAVTVLNDANFATGSQAVGNGPTSGGVRLMNAGSSESAGVAEVAFANASEAQPGEVTSMPAQLELVGVAQPARRWMLDDHEAADPPASAGDRVIDWVTARPVQRYVTQDDRDAGVPTGGVGATYLTPRDVEGALQGIDPGRSAGRALFEAAVLDVSATMRQWILAEDSLLRTQIRGATPLLGAEGVESAPPYSSTSMALLASGEFNVYHGRRSRLDVPR